MIIETIAADYAALLNDHAPRDFALADTPIAPREILDMLAGLAERIRADFATASWLIVEDGEVAGLCSITRPPEHGVIDIGYGIAPSRRRRGIATRAIGEIVAWARAAAHVSAITAETAIDNFASQQVLARNGFVRTGERFDMEDGQLICWRHALD